jgi:hypothetical protein
MNQAQCLILAKQRCDYFKKCVLPLAKLKGCYDRVFREYLKFDKPIDQSEDARFCECGTELPKGKKFCEKCRKKRRRETDMQNHQKHRGSCHTEV